MKKIFLAIFTVFSLLACNDAANKNATASTDSTTMNTGTNNSEEAKEERNKQTAMASVNAYEKGDADAVYKNWDADMVDYGDGSMKPLKNIDSAKASLKSLTAAFPDFKGSDFTAVADDNTVMVYGTWSGTWKNDMMGQKATGKAFNFKDVDIYKFNDAGKIVEHRSVQPVSEIMRQIGMKLPTP